MSKTIIVSNRPPVRMHTRDGKTVYKPSEGGLATGLSSVYKGAGNVWIGWPGKIVQGEQAKARVIEDLKPLNLCPVFLTREEIDDYYRSEEHTSELQSLMRNSYAVFCLKKKKKSKQRIPCR